VVSDEWVNVVGFVVSGNCDEYVSVVEGKVKDSVVEKSINGKILIDKVVVSGCSVVYSDWFREDTLVPSCVVYSETSEVNSDWFSGRTLVPSCVWMLTSMLISFSAVTWSILFIVLVIVVG